MELSIDQQKALALARARQRRKQQKLKPEAEPGFGDAMAFGIGQGLTFNTSDEIEAGLRTGFGLLGDYDQRLVQTRANMEAAREKYPGLFIGSEVGGGLLGAGGLAKNGLTLLRNAKPTLGSLIGRGSAEGAAYGALYGAGAGEDLHGRGAKAFQGAVIGGTAGGAIGGATARAVRKQAEKTIPSISQLKQGMEDAFGLADNAGVIFSPQWLQKLQAGVQQVGADFAYHPQLQPKAAVFYEQLARHANQPMTFEGFRKSLRAFAQNAAGSTDAAERKLGVELLKKIDDSLASVGQGDVVQGNVDTARRAFQEARELGRRFYKSQDIQTALTKAELRAASTGSGGNAENAARQNIRAILENPKRSRGFTMAEKAAMERVVRGSASQNAARLAGKMSPESGGLSAMLGTGATVANPFMAVGPVLGFASKRVADVLAKRNIRNLQNVVQSGGQVPKGKLSPEREAIANALIRMLGQRSEDVPLFQGR